MNWYLYSTAYLTFMTSNMLFGMLFEEAGDFFRRDNDNATHINNKQQKSMPSFPLSTSITRSTPPIPLGIYTSGN